MTSKGNKVGTPEFAVECAEYYLERTRANFSIGYMTIHDVRKAEEDLAYTVAVNRLNAEHRK